MDRLEPPTDRPEPAFERHELASKRPDPASKRPKPAFESAGQDSEGPHARDGRTDGRKEG